MRVCYPVCCGLDVHKKSVAACLRRTGADGKRIGGVRPFGTTMRALTDLADWLVASAAHAPRWRARVSPGGPCIRMLEERMTVLLVNAAHVSKVPGRKTDVKDCESLAELLEHG